MMKKTFDIYLSWQALPFTLLRGRDAFRILLWRRDDSPDDRRYPQLQCYHRYSLSLAFSLNTVSLGIVHDPSNPTHSEVTDSGDDASHNAATRNDNDAGRDANDDGDTTIKDNNKAPEILLCV